MTDKLELGVGWKLSWGCGLGIMVLLHGLLELPHGMVAGFPEQVSQESEARVHYIFMT